VKSKGKVKKDEDRPFREGAKIGLGEVIRSSFAVLMLRFVSVRTAQHDIIWVHVCFVEAASENPILENQTT